jgi:hypothetical protein
MFRKLIVFATVFLLALPLAHADEASKRAKIEEMFTVLKMDAMLKQMMAQGMAQGEQAAKSIFGEQPTTDADKKIKEEYLTKLNAAVSDALSWQRLKPAYIDLYADAYTEEEIDGILSFYKSPVGQSLLAKSPELMAKSGEIVSARMQELTPQLRQITEEAVKQFTAAHPDKTSPGAVQVSPSKHPSSQAQPSGAQPAPDPKVPAPPGS